MDELTFVLRVLSQLVELENDGADPSYEARR